MVSGKPGILTSDMRTITAAERRARMVRRHHLAPATRCADVVQVARDLVALHGTDPASVFLAARARMSDPGVAAIEDALYEERRLLRILGMRRTVFVVAREIAPIVHAACTREVAARARKTYQAYLEQNGIVDGRWLGEVESSTLKALVRRGSAFGGELVEDEPRLGRRLDMARGPETNYQVNLTSWVLLLPAAADPAPALLPALDPTIMGWAARDWYLGERGRELFDRSGNPCASVWWEGRVVGAWAQRKDGEVVFRLLEDLGWEAEQQVAAEAARLQAWIGEVRLAPRTRISPPIERELIS